MSTRSESIINKICQGLQGRTPKKRSKRKGRNLDRIRALNLNLFSANEPTAENSRESQIFDVYDYLDSNRLGSDTVRLGSPFWKNIDVPFTEDRVKVSSKLEMTRTGITHSTNGWIGKFEITNRTGIMMIYTVKSLVPMELYPMNPQINWIGPKRSCTFFVLVREQNIKDFLSKGQINVITVPIYAEVFLDCGPYMIERYWETTSFHYFNLPFHDLHPFSFESHKIKHIYKSEPCGLMDNWTILDGIYTGQKLFFGTEKSDDDELKFPEMHLNVIPPPSDLYQDIRNIKKYETARAQVQLKKLMKRKAIEQEQQRYGLHLQFRYLLILLGICANFGIAYFTQ